MADLEGSYSKNNGDTIYAVTVAQSSLQVRLGLSFSLLYYLFVRFNATW